MTKIKEFWCYRCGKKTTHELIGKEELDFFGWMVEACTLFTSRLKYWKCMRCGRIRKN